MRSSTTRRDEAMPRFAQLPMSAVSAAVHRKPQRGRREHGERGVDARELVADPMAVFEAIKSNDAARDNV